jgi:lysophospholipase L1-like esterase
MKRSLAIGAALAGAAIGFAGGWILHQPPAVPPDDGPTIPTIDLGSGGRYVALGDSYAAGEGLPGYEPGSEDIPAGDRCHRSLEFAFPRLLRFRYPAETERLHRACSGAVVANVFETVQRHDGVPSSQGLQVGPETLSGARLVTVTMGGNDVRFADMLIFCAKHTGCTDDGFERGETLAEFAERRLSAVGEDLTSMYTKLRAQTPGEARILVLGYPSLFPETIPTFGTHPFCRTVFKAFGESERTAIRGWNVELNEKVQAAAIAAGIEYVDVFSPFTGHEVCGSAGGWLKFVGDPSRQERDGWFHPTRAGQTMMARVVTCYWRVYGSRQEAINNDPADAFEMSACVADAYPTGDEVGPVSIPTPPPPT